MGGKLKQRDLEASASPDGCTSGVLGHEPTWPGSHECVLRPGVQIRKLYVAMIYTFSRFWWVRINPCAPKIRITFILHTNLHPVAKPSCKTGSRNIRHIFHILSFRLHAAPLKINLFHSLLGRRPPPPPPGRQADDRRTCAVERGNTAWHISIKSCIGCTLSLGPGVGVSSFLWVVARRPELWLRQGVPGSILSHVSGSHVLERQDGIMVFECIGCWRNCPSFSFLGSFEQQRS